MLSSSSMVMTCTVITERIVNTITLTNLVTVSIEQVEDVLQVLPPIPVIIAKINRAEGERRSDRDVQTERGEYSNRAGQTEKYGIHFFLSTKSQCLQRWS